jgi:predicted acylesterase/phospholipase RssA
VYGTSAGALTGALYAAGHAPDTLAAVLSERTPLSYLVRLRRASVAQTASARTPGLVGPASPPLPLVPRAPEHSHHLHACARCGAFTPALTDGLMRTLRSSRLFLRTQALSDEPLRGVLRLDGAVARLRQLLPPTFEALPRRFACGVVDASGAHRTISSGPLPEAVAASMAIPCLFRAVAIPGATGGPFIDGGKADRVGLRPWHATGLARPGRRTLCHVIARSSPFSGDDDVAAAAAAAPPGAGPVTVVRSPKSGQSLGGLADFAPQFAAARLRAAAALAAAPQLAR